MMRIGFKSNILLVFMALSFLCGCTSKADPVQIVQKFIAAVDSENLNAIYKLLADDFIVGYGGQEGKTVHKPDIRLAVEKFFREYNFELKTSNYQVYGDQVFFVISATFEKEKKTTQCTGEITISDGLIVSLKILFCNQP